VRRREILGGALAVSALAACGQSSSEAPAGGRTRIRFATDWRAQAEHGGFYHALASGEYARRGLDVEIIQGGPGVNVPQLLATGQVEAGLGSNAFITFNLAKENVPVRAVMAVFQKDPQVLMAHPDSGINKLEDMRGHPILLSDASVTAFWVWLKARYNFTDAQVRKYTFNSGPFLADKTSVQQGYLTSEPYTLETTANMKPKVFLLADNGYPGYAATVLTPQTLIDSNPNAVRAFVEGTAEGWRAYLHDDASAADALILRDNPEMTAAILTQARAKMNEYGIVEGGDAQTRGIGVMTDARWQAFFDTAGRYVYPADLDWKKAYTLDFIGQPAAPAPAQPAAAPKQ
jgi:NitT/TauT family transport system substrate-binding protein